MKCIHTINCRLYRVLCAPSGLGIGQFFTNNLRMFTRVQQTLHTPRRSHHAQPISRGTEGVVIWIGVARNCGSLAFCKPFVF